jgi:hypothetical protein
VGTAKAFSTQEVWYTSVKKQWQMDGAFDQGHFLRLIGGIEEKGCRGNFLHLQ